MFLGIIIPIKAKQVSRDWNITCHSLEATLASLYNQADHDFVVVIAGHDVPDFLEKNKPSNIEFCRVNFPSPERVDGLFNPQDLINDKNLKIISALKEINKYSPEYVFQLDSDDLLHKDFVKLLKMKGSFDFLTIDGGYILFESCQRYIITNELNQYCGSSVVIKSSHLNFPNSVDLEFRLEVPWTKHRHMNIHNFYKGTPSFKFLRTSDRLVSYVVASGDNFSDRWRNSFFKKLRWKVKPYLFGKRIDRIFRNNFGLL
ncbi:glycosyltransferase family A protein [Pelobacter seleniigenes]|uniref:glycosyltransferase family A protein n=1 Tax=Pelobacter seleniigenes TaxID=407188 RepID=UPI0004A76EC2|nr:glycosyltransferase family A protein [Pelobacter seleniigenes]